MTCMVSVSSVFLLMWKNNASADKHKVSVRQVTISNFAWSHPIILSLLPILYFSPPNPLSYLYSALPFSEALIPSLSCPPSCPFSIHTLQKFWIFFKGPESCVWICLGERTKSLSVCHLCWLTCPPPIELTQRLQSVSFHLSLSLFL